MSNTYKTDRIGELLAANEYAGRGIVIGKSADGKKAVFAYFIMGRSANSRNRIFEKTEDGIIIAGMSVGDGGLAAAASRMCLSAGLDMDISGIMASYQENDPGKVLFGEIPGVILQIRDSDYDYLDSQLILQDIAYYPLGHPATDEAGLTVSTCGRNSVADILATLMGQASEGED